MHLYTMRCVPIGTQLHTCDHLVLAQLRLPSEFEAAAEFVRPDDIARKIRCSSSVEQHLDWLLSDVEMGFEEINLHSIPRENQEHFIDVFGERVLPELKRATA